MRGFTLLEILLAMALVGVAILTMVGVYVGGLKLVAQSRERTAATDLARETLEAIKELSWDELPPGTARFDGRVPTPAQGAFPPQPYPTPRVNDLQYFVVVETAVRSEHLREVRVGVQWGERHVVKVATLVSE